MTLEEVPPPEVQLSDDAKEALMSAVASGMMPMDLLQIFIYLFDINEQNFNMTSIWIRLDQTTSLYPLMSYIFPFHEVQPKSQWYENRIFADQGFSIDNPNEPATVKHMSVEELHTLLSSENEVHLFDVRTAEERQIAQLTKRFTSIKKD